MPPSGEVAVTTAEPGATPFTVLPFTDATFRLDVSQMTVWLVALPGEMMAVRLRSSPTSMVTSEGTMETLDTGTVGSQATIAEAKAAKRMFLILITQKITSTNIQKNCHLCRQYGNFLQRQHKRPRPHPFGR